MFMKANLYFTILLISLLLNCHYIYATTFEGEISTEGKGTANRIIDKHTGEGIGNARISIPKQGFYTKTDTEGYFELDTHINGTSIMSVKKDHYKPFSKTVNDNTFSAPIVLGIEKSNSDSYVVDSNMYHLGDNNYSDYSANAGEFHMNAIGPAYSKKFILKHLKFNKPIFLIIGSIIGIDTDVARSLGQNKITNAFASPPEVYFNGNKIAEIKINGDSQKIRIPASLIKKNQVNEVLIKTGRNLMQTAYIDYDDIEFMNLFFEN